MTNTALTTYFNRRPSLVGESVFNELFNGMFQDIPSLVKQTTQGYPVTDIYEDECGATVLEFALAGFLKENVHVTVNPEKNRIDVSSDSHGDEEAQTFKTRRIARRAFHKTFVNYNNNLDLTKVSASFENGLLRVTVPVRPEAEPMVVKIK